MDEAARCEHCGKRLPERAETGRKRRYCDASCRSAARRARSSPHVIVMGPLTNVIRQGSLHEDVATAGQSALEAVVSATERVHIEQERLRKTVEHARAAGHTWAEIGEVLGTSRQAAFQRFGKPIDPRTGEPMGQQLLADAGERATALLVALTERRWDDVRADFDKRMAETLGTDQISSVWAQVIGSVGEYQRMDEPFCRQVGDYTTVDVTLHCEAGEIVGRVSYDGAARVAGLYLLPPEQA